MSEQPGRYLVHFTVFGYDDNNENVFYFSVYEDTFAPKYARVPEFHLDVAPAHEHISHALIPALKAADWVTEAGRRAAAEFVVGHCLGNYAGFHFYWGDV